MNYIIEFGLPVADMATSFWQSTLPCKIIVLILFIGSAAAWTIMVTKWMQLRLSSQSSEKFLNLFRAERDPIALYIRREEIIGTPLQTIYKAGCNALISELDISGSDPDDLLMGRLTSDVNCKLSLHQIETVRSVVDRNLADEILVMEDQMGLLATAVSAAPFLGLLGTVWGVMDTFSGMSLAGNAALSAVAPGISGALLTTIIGLIVALPSMIGYNLLSSEIRRISVQMDHFAQELVSVIQNKYVSEIK